MKLVPIPTPTLPDTWQHWWPWVQKICTRSKDAPSDVVRDLRAGTKQVHLLWDETEKTCKGVLGTEVLTHSKTGDKTCHLIWATGPGVKSDWADLLQQVQDYARGHLGCRTFQATARLGWKPTLKAAGFRFTHIVAEKDL